MSSSRSNSERFQDDPETVRPSPARSNRYTNFSSTQNAKERNDFHLKIGLKNKKLSRVFSEDYEVVQKKIFDPRGSFLTHWNKYFLVSCLLSLFVDPLFFYLPSVKEDACTERSVPLELVLTIVRSIIDSLYLIQIFIRFRTAYVAPSSRIYGRTELVIDPSKISARYLRSGFLLDALSALPLPQLLIWEAIPSLRGSNVIVAKHGLCLIIIFQFLLRLYLIFPLSSKIIRTAGVVVEAAWAGAAFNLVLFMLASHVIGSWWYLLSVERQEECWRKVCDLQRPNCNYKYFDCQMRSDYSGWKTWFESSNISKLCGPRSDFYHFGIYRDSLTHKIASSSFLHKYSYCLWWGLRTLSSAGQNLLTTTYLGEIYFAIAIAILGLVLFCLLIGNMQTYLQSTTARLEEWRVRRTDTEQWMHHRQLPHELKERIRKYDRYRWVTTRGVDEETILNSLPLDLRRATKHHLCVDLVRRVPLFDEMDECTLDAICERLKPVLCTPGTCLVREGDPVLEMVFILRGYLDSYTTNGGRTGFFNSCRLGSGDFCGEELLTWGIYPRPSILLPSSTRTVTAITEVEAFSLHSTDVKFVALQFRKLHSKQLKHKFRFYSHQWRTWAACFIQATWFRFKRRREAALLKAWESISNEVSMERCASLPAKASAEFAMYAAKLASSARRGGSLRNGSHMVMLSALQKPVEPDFSVGYKQ